MNEGASMGCIILPHASLVCKTILFPMHNIDAFRSLGSSYQYKTPHVETFSSRLLVAVKTIAGRQSAA